MPVFYFRNDDVNGLDEELIAVSRRCSDEGVPITHALEPANLSDEAVAWLLEEKGQLGRLVEIMQHGYDHGLRELGEFGGSRPYGEQYEDLKRGKEVLLDRFGGDFLPCLNYPFGPYNQDSMKAADRLGFRIVSSHYNHRGSRRAFYALGHALRMGQILGRHVSWHLDYYPRTSLFSIDMAASFIARYLGEHGSRTCEFHPLDVMKANIEAFIPYTPVIGVLLHHRFHHSPESLDLISETIRHLKRIPGAEFLNIEEIYRRYCPDPGAGFRNA